VVRRRAEAGWRAEETRVTRIIHTSDIHLGAPLGWLGKRAGEQREALKRAWTTVVDRALSERADCLIVAGTSSIRTTRPHPRCGSSSRNSTGCRRHRRPKRSSSRVSRLPEPGVGLRKLRTEFKRLPHVTVLGLDGRSSVVLRRSGVAVHGQPAALEQVVREAVRPVETESREPVEHRHRHGTVEVVPSAADDHPIALSDLSSMEWSYVALGHWHSWREIEGTTALAVYPGAPETVAIDQTGAGHAALVRARRDGSERLEAHDRHADDR